MSRPGKNAPERLQPIIEALYELDERDLDRLERVSYHVGLTPGKYALRAIRRAIRQSEADREGER